MEAFLGAAAATGISEFIPEGIKELRVCIFGVAAD
jgi:hypothetical protein